MVDEPAQGHANGPRCWTPVSTAEHTRHLYTSLSTHHLYYCNSIHPEIATVMECNWGSIQSGCQVSFWLSRLVFCVDPPLSVVHNLFTLPEWLIAARMMHGILDCFRDAHQSMQQAKDCMITLHFQYKTQ
jgi:hypothetical protein